MSEPSHYKPGIKASRCSQVPAWQMVSGPDLNVHPTGPPSREGSPVGIKKHITGASQKLSAQKRGLS